MDLKDFLQLKTRVISLMLEIRKKTQAVQVQTTIAKGSEEHEGCLNGFPVKRLIIYLRSSGCEWVMGRKKEGKIFYKPGCLDCEHSILGTTFGEPISANDYLVQFKKEFDRFDFKEHPILCVYNEGSFLNNRELPDEARRNILSLIGKNQDIKVVVLESLPQYITKEIIDEIVSLLPNKKIEIGIGLESSNEQIRGLCINKPYSLEQFEGAVKILKDKCSVLAYVLLKPSFLSEGEAINDAVETCKYAFSHGVDIVSLEPVSIGTNTMASFLAKENLYSVPKLWSAIEVVKKVNDLGEVRIGGFQFSPSYLHKSSNCSNCTATVLDAIALYNQTRNIEVLSDLHCQCKRDWEVEIKNDNNFIDSLDYKLSVLESKL